MGSGDHPASGWGWVEGGAQRRPVSGTNSRRHYSLPRPMTPATPGPLPLPSSFAHQALALRDSYPDSISLVSPSPWRPA